MSPIKITSATVIQKKGRVKAKDKNATYYQRFGDQLRKQIREYEARRAQSADLFSGRNIPLRSS